MGLLSRAATGGFGHSPSQGGLLKLVFKKQFINKEYSSGVSIPEAPDTEITSPLEKAVMEKLSGAYAKFGTFQGIIIETTSTASAEEFTGRLAFMISGFAAVQGLSPGRCLVLFNSREDAELLGHHLERTVPGTIICSFRAQDPGEAFPLIKSHL